MIAAIGNSAKATKAQSLASETALMPSAGSLSARRRTVTALRRAFAALALLSLSACGSLDAIFDPDSEVVRTLELRDEALADYLGPYQNDGLHKAFAVSGNGVKFGAAFNYDSQDEAQRAALAKCTEALVTGDIECVVYDVDGEIVLFLPVTLRKYQG